MNAAIIAEAGALVPALLTAFPLPAMQTNAAGQLPLHELVARSSQSHWDANPVLEAFLSANPAAAAAADPTTARLPLHALVASGGWSTPLLAAYPAAATVPDPQTGQLLLHQALTADHSSKEAMQAHFQANPAAAAQPDPLTGYFPLHQALLWCKHSLQVLSAQFLLQLLGAHPQAAAIKMRSGYYALHLAVTASIDEVEKLQLVPALLSAYPLAALMRSEDGDLPLHKAARQLFNASLVKALLDACPSAAAVANRHGVIALHVAAAKQTGPDDVSVIQALVRAFAEGSLVLNQDGQLPLHCAAARAPESTVTATLLAALPE